MSGTLTLLTNSTKGLIELDNGDKMLYDIDRVFHSPSMEQTKGVRFDAFPWSYFFLYPYKLSDPGTHWSEFEANSMNDRAYDVRKLTFYDGTGDSPKDWYVTYFDPKTHLVEAAAYIVTLNQDVSEAEKSPHAIKYSDYSQVEGIPLAHEWTFWEWDSANGLTKQLGEATLSDFEFIVVKDDFFKAPEDFMEAK